jgi:hypothetical protein
MTAIQMTAIQTEEKEEEVVDVPAGAAAAVGNTSSNAQRRNEDFPDAFYCQVLKRLFLHSSLKIGFCC